MKVLLAGALLFMATACSANRCMMDGAAVPDRERVLANSTNGQLGRDAMAAVFEGDVETLRRLVAADRRVLDTKVVYDTDFRPDGQWGDLMTVAVTRCDAEMVRALLDLGASPNGADYGFPLATALETRTPAMAALLLDAGADPDPTMRGGQDALMSVMTFGGIGAMELLLRHGLDPNRQQEISGDTPLWLAVATEQYAIAHLLMDRGANPWLIDGSGASTAWTLARGGPIVFGGGEQGDLYAKLIERAKLPGVPWPPPDLEEMRRMVMNGRWPTPAASAAGAPPIRPEQLAYMREYYNPDGSAKADEAQ